MLTDSHFWANQSIIVTGGAGFLGSYVVRELKVRSCENIFVVRSSAYDLRHEAAVRRLYADVPATMVIHMAAVVGGSESRIGHGDFDPQSGAFDR